MYIKGMNKDMTCRGFKFEIGKEYKIDHGDRPIELCTNTVFHFCDSLQKVHRFYECNNELYRFFVIEALGEIVSDGDKCGSDHIRIVREITGEELDIMKGLVNGNTGLFNSGDRNSGNMNSGDMNSGNMNSGDMNSGDMNSGNRNSGNRNSGNRNSGNRNSGFANKCDFSNGVFCNESDMNIRIFNKPSGMSLKDFFRSKYYDALTAAPFELTSWIWYTGEEKADDPKKDSVGGYLIVKTYEEAWADWWEQLPNEARNIIQQIPNFDAEIFKDITGIDFSGESNE